MILKLDGEDNSKLPNDFPKKMLNLINSRATKKKLV
jgi:hypothetical protein